VQISCKLTNTILEIFDQKGIDSEVLFEDISLSDELLRDPNYWIDISDLELFLEKSIQISQDVFSDQDLLKYAGHQVTEIRSWGALDSVLRIMPNPQEILQSPKKFLSYFVSQCPEIETLERNQKFLKIKWKTPFALSPYVQSFLKYAFEALPVFVNQPLAQVIWNESGLQVNWSPEQTSIFNQNDPGRQVSPDLFQSVVSALQQTQIKLEQKNIEESLSRKKQKQAQQQSFFDMDLAAPTSTASSNELSSQISSETIEILENNLNSLKDYMTRAQQLVTILGLQNAQNHLAQVALKKIDWEQVKIKSQKLIHESQNILSEVKIQNLKATKNIYQRLEREL
jgi:hypothetical protein